jgi:hypothetical protein
MLVADRVLFFTVHKAASMFLFEVARDLATLKGLPFHSPHGGIYFADDRMADAANWTGVVGCVSPIREFVDLPTLDADRALLHLRDPRDVITSLYYSMAYSHRLEGNLTAEERSRWLERGVDASVYGDYDGVPVFQVFKQRYRDYLDHLAWRPNVTLLRYEDMIADLPTWLHSVVRAFDFADEDAVVAELLNRHQGAFDVAGEDVMRHKRQVMPGDHRRRMRPETVRFLNAEFADILQELGYAE